VAINFERIAILIGIAIFTADLTTKKVASALNPLL
jgi:hypothetical protein